MRIAVGQVEIADAHPVHLGLEITGLFALSVLGPVDAQPALDFDRLHAISQDRDAVEALLPMPDGMIADAFEFFGRKALVHRLDFLQAGDRRASFFKPLLEAWQAGLDPVDVESGDTHGRTDARKRRAGLT